MSQPATSVYVEPVFKTVRVHATPQHAFEVFTEGFLRWWIPSHSINPTKSPMAAVIMEPRVGGRWYERGEDDSTCEWGHVLVWEPPHRVVLTWEINAEFVSDPTCATELEVRFKALEDGHTEVTLEHRHLERFGASAQALRTALSGGWGTQMERYRDVF